MDYQCPDCGNSIERAFSKNIATTAGIVGILFTSAFGGFHCKTCGKVPFSKFPIEVRKRMIKGTLLYIIAALLVLSFAIWVVINI
ncbi:MAG: hypothetical protein NTU44_13550 [Bacteroidetes bacterium]|nr:hypothetical protein [Bacteroidota bacterium]